MGGMTKGKGQLPDLNNTNTGCPVTFEFQINNKYCMGYTCNSKAIHYLSKIQM